MNLSFAGCGFLGIYHVGVAVCFKKYAPHLLLEKIGGASAGALAACCLLCDLPLGQMTSDFFRVVKEARSHSLGPFSPSFNIQTCLLEGLQKHLPEDAHKRVNGRLHISLTRVYDGKNVIVSQFDSREDVLQALLCACFIPGFSGILPPRFRGVRYMDGAFSDNLPILDENTITVSPFCGESDICPRDQSSQLFHLNWANTSIEISRQNINRFIRILFPPRPEFLSNLCQQGFDDALQFLHRNNLINCTRCVSVQSTFVVSETVPDTQYYDPECRDCKKHRADALLANMPETVVDVIQGYIDFANKGLSNWLFKNKSIKLLSLPATVPADFFLATINKLSKLAPHIIHQLRHLIKLIVTNFNETVASKMLTKLNMNFELDLFDCIGGMPVVGSHESRRKSRSFDEINPRLRRESSIFGEDTFGQFLKVATHQDAVYAYYYTDESNKVKVTEIFDMTNTECLPTQFNVYENPTEIDNRSMQMGDEWNGIESDLFLGSPFDIYENEIIEANNNDIISTTEQKINYSEIKIEDSTSDYSDPEVDHYVSGHSKSAGYTPAAEQKVIDMQH